MSELVVVCSLVCPLPTPPAGVQLSVLPPLFWRVFLGSLPPGLAPQAVLQLDAAQADLAQDALAALSLTPGQHWAEHDRDVAAEAASRAAAKAAFVAAPAAAKDWSELRALLDDER